MEIVLQVDSSRHVGVASWVGVDVPLHASAGGRLALAELDDEEIDAWLAASELESLTDATRVDPDELRTELARVRRQGWSEVVDELETGLASLAVPVRTGAAALVGMVGVSGPTFRLGRARRRELIPVAQAAAAEIERALP
jgi:IclR family pca regulon transcriptional regulator